MTAFQAFTQSELENLKKAGQDLVSTEFSGYTPIKAGVREILRQNRRRIKAEDIKLLQSPNGVPEGQRSEAEYALGARLLEAGIPFDHAFILIHNLKWSKFRDRDDSVQRVWEGLQRARENSSKLKEEEHAPPQHPQEGGLRESSVSANDLVLRHVKMPTWLIDGIWTENTCGFIAGRAKTYKSTFATDLGLAVATGKPFMNYFEVHNPGPVVMIQEENDEGLQKDRLIRMMKAKGIELPRMDFTPTHLNISKGEDVPFHFVNNFGFILQDQDMVDELEEWVGDLKPRMIILDPLYLVAGSDIMSLSDMTEVIRWMVRMKTRFQTSVVIVHHFKKQGESQQDPMERMTGSAGLSYGFDSALLMDPVQGSIRCNRVFRHWRRNPFEFDIFMEEAGDSYEVKVTEQGVSKEQHPLLDLVMEHAAQGLPLQHAVKELKMTRQGVVKAAKRLPIRITSRKTRGGGKPTILLFPEATDPT